MSHFSLVFLRVEVKRPQVGTTNEKMRLVRARLKYLGESIVTAKDSQVWNKASRQKATR